MQKENFKKLNQISYYCPICGKLVKADELKHRCSKRKLNALDALDINTIDFDIELEEKNMGDMLIYAEMLLTLQEDIWDIEEEFY